MSGAATVLDRLARVKLTRPSQYAAACPVCLSKAGRPIAVRELDDGRTLLHAFCGCSTEDVLLALGLTLTDLYPQRLPGTGPAGGYASTHSKIPARDLLEVISAEVSVVSIIAARMLDGKKPTTEADWPRLAKAAARIHRARDHIHHG
jgi:hypothetical protein